MRILPLKYVLAAATVISLLTSCAGGSSTPSTTTASQPNQSRTIKHQTSSCPCLYVADARNDSVAVYAEGATGDATPIQTIRGFHTRLAFPTDVAVDASRDIYVANEGNSSVTVYSAGATGNVAPIQTIAGSMTGLFEPRGIALNPLNGNIYVANSSNGSNDGTVTIYPPGSSGNIAPIGIIKGSRTGLDEPAGLFLGGSGKIYVPNRTDDSVTVYRAGATRGVPPIQTISGSNTGLDNPLQVLVGPGLRSTSDFQCRRCGTSAPLYAFEQCERLEPIALVITRTGRPCSFGRMSRWKSTPSRAPSSRHPSAGSRPAVEVSPFLLRDLSRNDGELSDVLRSAGVLFR